MVLVLNGCHQLQHRAGPQEPERGQQHNCEPHHGNRCLSSESFPERLKLPIWGPVQPGRLQAR